VGEHSYKIVVGLGNPGKDYENTRHNLGARIVESFAKSKDLIFKRSLRHFGRIAKVEIEMHDVLFLLPTTYMNASGKSVKSLARTYECGTSDLLVVVDDIDLEFGQMRFRPRGGSGGHNGLKSIEASLGNPYYHRLRVGIGRPEDGIVDAYVLGRFSKEESEALSKIEAKAHGLITAWLILGIEKAMETLSKEEK
jgi:peptidyl-tRNA hydrolase, PTH1 family